MIDKEKNKTSKVFESFIPIDEHQRDEAGEARQEGKQE